MRISTAGVARRNGKILVALRKPGTSIGESWEFPGGKLEEGESPPQGLVREYKEEFNLDIEVNGLLHESTFVNKGRQYRLMAFDISITGGEMNHPEHQEVKWLFPREMRELTMAPSDRAILETLLKQ